MNGLVIGGGENVGGHTRLMHKAETRGRVAVSVGVAGLI